MQDRVLTLGGVAESQLGALSMHVEKLGDIPLYAPPGQVFEYSVGFDVAARIAEIVTGKDLASVVRETVFEPMGMEDSHFYVPKDKMKRLARLYGPRGRTYQLPGKPRRYRNYVGLPKDQNFGGTVVVICRSVGIVTTAFDYQIYALCCDETLTKNSTRGRIDFYEQRQSWISKPWLFPFLNTLIADIRSEWP